jgi:hypothetical protein
VSVAELPGTEVPDHSTFVVSDPNIIDGVREQYEGIFGTDIVVRAADVLIEGVNIELVLGRDFLATLQAPTAPGVGSSSADGSTPATSSTPATTAAD